MFLIRIHYGGTFQRYPGRRYFDGHVGIFDMVDVDMFITVALDIMVVQLCYTGKSEPMYYNYLRPLTSLDEGLYALACEEDVYCLATLVRSFKLIEVYIKHGVTAVDSYRRPPPRVRVTIEDITDEPGSIAAIEHRSEKMLLLTWHDSSEPTKEPVCDSITPRSLPQHDSSTPCKDSVFESVTPRSMPRCMLTHPTDESVITYTQKLWVSHDDSVGVDDLDLNLNEHVDLKCSQIETQFELSVSEEPDVGRTQEPIMEEVRTQKPIVEEVIVEDYVSSGKDVEHDSAYETQYDVQSSEDTCIDDDDDDFLVDEENEIVKPHVDVHLFGIAWVPFDNIGVTNLVPDDVLEGEDVDVINVDGFDSDHGNDNKTSNYMRKRLAELSREIKGVINASGQWKYSFYIGQKFTTVKEAKDRGIIPAIKNVFPSAEHRYCLRHIHENMKHRWCGQEYKDLLWISASATIVRSLKSETLTRIPCKHDVAACWNIALNDRVTPAPKALQQCRSSSASRQAQQAEPAVGQDGSGVDAVIGLSVADYAGGAGVGIGSQEEIMVMIRKRLQKTKATSYNAKLMHLEDDMGWYIDEMIEQVEKIADDLRYIAYYIVAKGMDDHVPDEIDGAKGEQVPNHLVKKGNLEFLVCKQVANHGGDKLVDKGRPLKRKKGVC
uniref:PB1-like domain-containing protein n=1 Tax=Tanacetum cinerariifolium TaxID=118510 RepID=A0A6L2MPE4_TANCI|nr:hypothetical protein [Tanacetum cinerariifolium]